MSNAEIVLGILLGLVVNEFCDVSPWLARIVIRWSADIRYKNAPRQQMRADELVALIEERPGKLFKLLTAAGFLVSAIFHVSYHGSSRQIKVLAYIARHYSIKECREAIPAFLRGEGRILYAYRVIRPRLSYVYQSVEERIRPLLQVVIDRTETEFSGESTPMLHAELKQVATHMSAASDLLMQSLTAFDETARPLKGFARFANLLDERHGRVAGKPIDTSVLDRMFKNAEDRWAELVRTTTNQSGSLESASPATRGIDRAPE
ncbi:hypothetical protein F5972_27875 [Microbispora cellulosiformans]|uniref:Uncharacterized protein n=1 Tax=Microbispora cellulosiformans TaxID=2614688 RepID=A0A5J5JXX1_9ACTN|nr:hypothetical protein [Microbispora cellulosiformans]KAA9375200.1 hypothetical protein F5972_27875 [Microbispora cellulosiformans]